MRTVRALVWILPLMLAAVLLSALAGCGAASPSTPSVLPGPQANLPVDSELPTAAGFNPPAYVDAATLAAANLEVERLRTAVVDYLTTHPGAATVSSDDLQESTPIKALYRFNAGGAVTRVDAVPDGSTGIVFSLSQQKWTRGTPDNDRPGDQDVP